MKLGISTYTYSWAIGIPGLEPVKPLDFFGLIDKAKALNVGLIQVADNLPLHSMSEPTMNLFIRRANELKIQLESGARGMTEEHLDRYIKLAHKIRSPILRFIIDGENFIPGREDIIAIINNALKDLENKKIILAIENYERLSVKDLAWIIDKIGSDWVGICLDTVNSLGAGEGIEKAVMILGPITVNLHIKEFKIRRLDHKLGFLVEGAPAGDGMLNIPWLLQQLSSHCRSAILEQWTPWANDIQSTIKKENEWAERSIEYLRNFFD